MEYILTGNVKLIKEPQTFASGFIKREIVITTEEQYPQDIKIDFVKELTSLLDNVNIGDRVDISFNVKGNEYQDKYYVSLQGWKLKNHTPKITTYSNNTTPSPSVRPQEQQVNTPTNTNVINSYADLTSGAEIDDELPF